MEETMLPSQGFFEQSALISALMLGFALTVFVSLMEMGDKRKIVGVTMAFYLITVILLLLDTYINIRLVLEFSQQPDPVPVEVLERMGRAYEAFSLLGNWGVMTLVIAISLTGWIRSPWLGVLSTTGAIISFWLLIESEEMGGFW
jgi:hypothetical protein